MAHNIIVASHRRSGTHLTIDAIINNFKLYHENPPINRLTLDHLSSYSSRNVTTLLDLKTLLATQVCVMKTHSHGNERNFFVGPNCEYICKLLSSSKIIYVYRDGRDVMVSLYYYMQLFDNTISAISFSDFIHSINTFDTQTYVKELSRPAYWMFHVNSWISKNNILIISFQDLTTKYAETIKKIAVFIEQPLHGLVDVRRSQLKSGILPKITSALKSRKKLYSSVAFRKGFNGDWVTYFTNDDLLFFNAETENLNFKLGNI